MTRVILRWVEWLHANVVKTATSAFGNHEFGEVKFGE